MIDKMEELKKYKFDDEYYSYSMEDLVNEIEDAEERGDFIRCSNASYELDRRREYLRLNTIKRKC